MKYVSISSITWYLVRDRQQTQQEKTSKKKERQGEIYLVEGVRNSGGVIMLKLVFNAAIAKQETQPGLR